MGFEVSFDNFLRMTKDALKLMHVTANCQTCGKVFLDVPASVYVSLSRHLSQEQPDKWFVESGIHWCENEGHLILFTIQHSGKTVHNANITQVWDNKLALDQSRNTEASRSFQKPHFYKNREECKSLPI